MYTTNSPRGLFLLFEPQVSSCGWELGISMATFELPIAQLILLSLANTGLNHRKIHRKTNNRNHLIFAFFFQIFEFGVINPVNAINRTSVDRLCNQLFRIPVLSNYARSTIIRFNIKSIASNVSTVLAANAGNFINIDTLLPQDPAQLRFQTRAIGPSRKKPPNSGSSPERSVAVSIPVQKAQTFRPPQE